ncbi:MAG: hypothetical protein AAB012_04115 [Nitrospirota bacterium]|jgi:hypothetical protein
MKAFLCFLLALFSAIAISTEAMSKNAAVLEDKTLLLESELELAKKPQIYFIFNLKNGEIFLKSRGVMLKKMKIEDTKFWGRHLDTKPRTLLKKSTLFEPKREKIEPQKSREEETTDTSSFEVKALELKDMPTSYRLVFHESIFISIRPKATGIISKLYNTGRYISWYLSRPLLTVWNSIRNKPFTAIYLTVNEEDAQSIYWSLTENSKSIIYHP